MKNTKVFRLLKPIGSTKGRWWLSFFANIRDGFQSIAKIHIGLFLIMAIEQKNPEELIWWSYALVGLMICSYIMQCIGERATEKTDGYIILDLKRTYLYQYLHMNNTEVEKIGTGKMQDIIFNGIDKWFGIIQDLLTNITVEVFAIIYAFILIASQVPDRRYFIGFLFLFGLSIFFTFLGLKVLHRVAKKSKEFYGELHRQEIKVLMNKFEVLQNNKFEKEMDKIEDISWSIRNLWIQGNIKKTLWQKGSDVIIDGSEVFLYVVGGLFIISGNYFLASLVLLLGLVRTISTYLWNIRTKGNDFFKDYVHVMKLREVFDTIPRINKKESTILFSPQSGDIKFINISFGYNTTKKIFSDFSLVLLAGSVTALVGPSGGGKSTLMKLIAGYIMPQTGQVVVDNQVLQDVYIPSYYKHIGYLTQEPSVFDGTIYDNLTYALDYNPKQEEINQIIQKSQCQFVYDLPDGIDTEIGERGVHLSGGQRQRLAIAKIMLKNPNIILLDEPTSALDSISEELVTQALNELFKDRTVIIIAHRLQTVKHADEILVIDSGQIIERGNHDVLIAENGSYAKMLELQSGF